MLRQFDIDTTLRILSRSPYTISDILYNEWHAPSIKTDGSSIEMAAYAGALLFFFQMHLNAKDITECEGINYAITYALDDLAKSWFHLADGTFQKLTETRANEFRSILGKDSLPDFAKETTQTFLQSIRIPSKLNISELNLKSYLLKRYSEYVNHSLQISNPTEIDDKFDQMLLSALYGSSSKPVRPANKGSIFETFVSSIAANFGKS